MPDPACLPSKRRRLTADAPLYEQPFALSAPAAGPQKQSPTTAEQAPELPALLEQPPESSGLAEESPEPSNPADKFSKLSVLAESLKQPPDLSPAPERDSPSERPAELFLSATPAEQPPEVPSDKPTDLSIPPACDSHQLSSSSLLLENGALTATTYSDPAQADYSRPAVARTTRSKARSESSGPGDDVSDGGHVTQVVPHVWRTARSRRSALTASQAASSPLATSSGLATTKNGATVAEDGVAERAAVAENTAAQKAAAENLVMDKAVSEKAAAEKEVTEKATVKMTEEERAAAEKEAREKVAAEELALSADVKRKRRMMTLRSPYRLSLYFIFIVSKDHIFCFVPFVDVIETRTGLIHYALPFGATILYCYCCQSKK
jgi:hypothetical protein